MHFQMCLRLQSACVEEKGVDEQGLNQYHRVAIIFPSKLKQIFHDGIKVSRVRFQGRSLFHKLFQ